MGKLKPSLKNRKDIIAYIILISLAAVMINMICKNGYLYGSETDWISQHSVIPDYFRQKFYETENLFPDYALNLGGGQNIYYFSYYGLLNPITLFSYLLPAVPMATYVSASGIAMVIISVCLCYLWLRSEGFSYVISCVSAICFLFAGPVIFHSHRQVMFVNYFPFLLLGFLSVKQYYKTHQKWLLVLSVFLCVMTSYFFSVGCILALLVDAVYQYVEMRQDFTVRGLWREMLPLVLGIGIAVCMAAILWLPTFYVIVNGRGAGGSFLSSILPVLLPDLSYAFDALLYDKYSLGLSAISLIALIAALMGKKKNAKVLSAILLAFLIFPVFSYFLSGTLYVRPKALIPFLPLYILIIAIFLTVFVKRSEVVKPFWRRILVGGLFLLIIGVSGLVCLLENTGNDLISTEESLGHHPQMIIAQIQEALQSKGDELVPAKEYSDIHHPDKIALIGEILQKDPAFYRMNDLTNSSLNGNQVYGERYYQTSLYSSTYNTAYNRFYFDVLHNPISTRNRVNCASAPNLFFQNFMNVKYLITKKTENLPTGYRQIAQKGDYLLYENDNTWPLAFATGQTMKREDFDNLAFPYNMGALFENIIVEQDKGKGERKDLTGLRIQKVDWTSKNLYAENQKNVMIRNLDGHCHIAAKKNAALEVPLDIDLKDTILILRFTVSNKENQANLDTSITVNGIKNKLSKKTAQYPNGNRHFVYVLSANESTKRLTVKFSQGKYEIYDFEAYTLPAADMEKSAGKMDSFLVDTQNTTDHQIAGDILVENDGYLATTLPYDKGYDITVDGKNKSYEKVNTAFVGFPIQKGTHHIVMEYHAPYKRAGMILTYIGFLLFALCIVIDHKRRKLSIINNGGRGENDSV